MLDDPKIPAYLEALCKQVTDDVIGNIMFLDAMRRYVRMNDPQIVRGFTERADRLGKARLDLPGRSPWRTVRTVCGISKAH